MAAWRGGTMAMAMLATAWISAALPAPARAQGAVAAESRGGGPRGAAAGAFRAEVLAADAALSAGRGAAAQERIERAETMLLNARRGAAGRGGRLAARLEVARAAAARGDLPGARAALHPLVRRLSRAGAAGGKA